MSALSLLVALTAPLRGQAAVRLTATTDPVPVGFAARVATEIARTWGVGSDSLVLNFGAGSLAGVADSTGFRLLGAGESGWFALVTETTGRRPVAVRLRAGRTIIRQVASRALRVGMTLLTSDIRAEPHLVWGPPSGPAGALAGEGWVVRRPTAAGAPLDRAHVTPPPVIAAGQPVRVLWQEGAVSIALDGTAMNDAAVGESVRVRTGGRTGVVQGRATAFGEARMP